MDELRTGDPMVAAGVTIVPVERCRLESNGGKTGGRLSGRKEPYAVVLCDAGGVRAFNAVAETIPVASLTEKIPDLGPLLDSLPEGPV